MLDFVTVSVHQPKKDVYEVYPEYETMKSSDLMVRGKAFYAVWDEEAGLWSRDELDVARLVDRMIREKCAELKKSLPETAVIKPKLMRKFSSRKWTEWQTYVKSLPDNYHELDAKVIFSNTKTKKKDYISRKLPYAIEKGSTAAYDEMIGTLYSKTERQKLEWAIGSIIAGDSKDIQKFIVIYGESGSGKSTFLDIVKEMFDGYCADFKSQELGMSNSEFALEAFRSNPLIAIDPDGNLSRIEDNTRINSIVAHESMLVNEKFKSKYSMKFNTFLFIGTNSPVKITEAKSGIIRRLIDVMPTGNTLPQERYEYLKHQIGFELGAIAYHCLEVYKEMGPRYYSRYKPNSMISATNDFYNFMEDNYDIFTGEDGVTLDAVWTEYKKYAVEANLKYPFTRRVFKEELKNYFTEYKERYKGRYKVYLGFRRDRFDYASESDADEDSGGAEGESYISEDTPIQIPDWLKLDKTASLFDKVFKKCKAQLASDDGTPAFKWSSVKTTLSDILTTKLHYVLVPENLIVIDFDLRDADGNKDPQANLIAASKWPKTYAEYSKSGGGIHLHYYYNGDVLQLSRIFEENIEVKVFKKNDGTRGYSSLRRALSFCNDEPIATINSGLPLKGVKEVVNFEAVKSEKALRTLILRNLNKEYHGATAPSVDFIFKILEDAYNGPLSYDVSDLRPDILQFAMKSTHQSSKCVNLVAKMHFKSKEISEGNENYDDDAPIIFFDIETFVNLFVVCWKRRGAPKETTVKMINPTQEEVKKLFRFRLVGFNNRRYDNHILYAASLGYSLEGLYDISQRIINGKGDRGAFFGEAYNLSYTDIYDFASKKQSLKKWEIELGIHHQELGLPWDQPVDKSLWEKVADYCVNDVIATEAVFEARHADFETRQLLADLSGLTVNDPNRLHITRILVGNEKKPRHVYTDLATGKRNDGSVRDDILGAFPGYEMIWGEDKKPHNMYRGTDVGFGGYVYGEQGMFTNVALLDVGNMHGASILALNKFGEYTKNYADIREARMAIKARRFDDAKKMLDGKLVKPVSEIEALPTGSDEQIKAIDDLQGALKLILNSTYGIAAATFDNPLRDPVDKNNIIALRGALFMRTLQDEVVNRGFKVCHIKTDSIKIPEATDDIIQFVIDFGRKYGYEFEHECTYEKFCLVNDAVYIAKYDSKGVRNKGGIHAGEWTATGKQFQVPYVFKTLFSKKKIEHKDVCETKETKVGSGLYLDMNEGLGPDEHDYHFIGRVGQFCPIKPGCGGGVLVRELNGKYHAATGTKKESYDKKGGEEPVYRWLESEVVEQTNKWADIDESYYRVLVDEAVSDISVYGDFEWFVSDDPVPPPISRDFINVPEGDEEEVPFD